jgi:hypothetical protein
VGCAAAAAAAAAAVAAAAAAAVALLLLLLLLLRIFASERRTDAPAAVSIMRSEGADVIQKGESWVEANDHALQLVSCCMLFSDPTFARDLPSTRICSFIYSSPADHCLRRIHTPVRP